MYRVGRLKATAYLARHHQVGPLAKLGFVAELVTPARKRQTAKVFDDVYKSLLNLGCKSHMFGCVDLVLQ